MVPFYRARFRLDHWCKHCVVKIYFRNNTGNTSSCLTTRDRFIDPEEESLKSCLLYTSDAADER